MVVEDDPALREFYRAALAAAGHYVEAVGDGGSALQLIDSGTMPATVVLDMGLPYVSGRDVLNELRAQPATCRIPVVVVSGTDVRDIKVQKWDAILRKPVTADALIDTVSECLQRAALLFP
jgi:DNA-binding response OmpR family regulator